MFLVGGWVGKGRVQGGRRPWITAFFMILGRLDVDKHGTRLQKSQTIIMQHFSDYSPRDALHKANKAHTGGLLLP